jgi:hypothetical protein
MRICNIDDESTMNVNHFHDWDWDWLEVPMIGIVCKRCGMCMSGELEHTNPPEMKE